MADAPRPSCPGASAVVLADDWGRVNGPPVRGVVAPTAWRRAARRVTLLIDRCSTSALSRPRVAVSLASCSMLMLFAVGAGAPNVNTPQIRLPLSVLPAFPALLSYVLTVGAIVIGGVGLAGMLWANSRGWRPRAGRVFLVGCALVAIVVSLTPVGSSDVVSYATYGRIAATGQDPYVTTPAMLGGSYLHVMAPTWRNTPSVYGPVATWLQALAAQVGGDRPWATVWTLMVINGIVFLAVGYLVMRTAHDPVRAGLLWTVNPLLIQLLVAGGHLDTLLAAAVIGVIVIVRRWPTLWGDVAAGLLAGVACAIKADAALLCLGLAVPLLRRGAWARVCGIGAATLGTALVLYLGYGYAALRPLSSASQLVSTISPWHLVESVGREAVGSGVTSTVITISWPLVLVLLAWWLRRGTGHLAPAEAAFPVLLFLAWVIAAPWSMPWYTAPAWTASTLLPRSLLIRWLAAVTLLLALLHNSGGHGW